MVPLLSHSNAPLTCSSNSPTHTHATLHLPPTHSASLKVSADRIGIQDIRPSNSTPNAVEVNTVFKDYTDFAVAYSHMKLLETRQPDFVEPFLAEYTVRFASFPRQQTFNDTLLFVRRPPETDTGDKEAGGSSRRLYIIGIVLGVVALVLLLALLIRKRQR